MTSPSLDFSFRLKIRMARGRRLAFEEPEWQLPDPDGHDVRMKSLKKDEPLREAEWIAVRGSGYPSEEAAAGAGEMFRGVLERAFAQLRVGADFGDRSLGGFNMAQALVEVLERESQRPAMSDRHGLMTFPTEPPPMFFGGSAQGYAPPHREAVVAALTHGAAREPVDEIGRLAYELFGAASFVEDSPEARFMLLMMSVETLIECQDRSAEAQSLVREYLDSVRASDLPQDEKDSLQGQLGFMLQESISQAGRRVAESLTGQTYGDLDPVAFFRKAYGLRSRLAHPTASGPSRQEVSEWLGPLEAFVGDLLAGPRLVWALAPDGRES